MSKILAGRWKTLQKQKDVTKKYQTMASKDKKRYKAQMKAR
jgi:hypothetical protein